MTWSCIYRWKQHSTTGTPPLGVRGYASCSVDRDIIYFGGYCGHDTCYHNSMFGLGAENLVWREFLATSETSGPMRKGYCAVLQFDSRLLVIGGRGDEPPGDPSPSATYEIRDGLVYTNEHHLFHTLSGKHHLVTYDAVCTRFTKHLTCGEMFNGLENLSFFN